MQALLIRRTGNFRTLVWAFTELYAFRNHALKQLDVKYRYLETHFRQSEILNRIQCFTEAHSAEYLNQFSWVTIISVLE
jgi:hypothetical protein